MYCGTTSGDVLQVSLLTSLILSTVITDVIDQH